MVMVIFILFYFLFSLLAEKPRLKQVTVVNVFGKPVQELTLQWVALDANLTYKLFIGRIPYTEQSYSFCQFHNSAFCTRIPKNKHEVLSCHVEKKVLGHLFHWQELSEPCGSSNRCDTFCAKVVVENAFGASESASWWNLKHQGKNCGCTYTCKLLVGTIKTGTCR